MTRDMVEKRINAYIEEHKDLVAYHEAGHILVACSLCGSEYLLGADLHSVQCATNINGKDMICVLLAGKIAERIKGFKRDGWGGDIVQARKLAKKENMSRKLVMKECYCTSKSIIAENIGALDILASELLKNGELSYWELQDLIANLDKARMAIGMVK